MEIKFQGASCIVTAPYKGCCSLFCLETLPEWRGKRSATKLLRIVRRWADKKGFEVVLGAAPYRDKPMSREQLECFYKKNGFKRDGEAEWNPHLYYTPKRKTK